MVLVGSDGSVQQSRTGHVPTTSWMRSSTRRRTDRVTRRSAMPRPPSDRVEEGFAIWSTEADRNDTRTAELMGVPQSTVSYWHRTYHLDERSLTFNQSDGQLMAGVALAGMRAGLPAVTARLLHIA